MAIFDHQGSLDAIGYPYVVPSDGSDVDEQASLRVDPSRINDIEPVRLCPFHIARVDLEHVVSPFGNVR